jgi:hypothetical protein
MFGVWWLNRRTDSGEPVAGEALVPAGVRRAARVFAVAAFVAAAVLFLAPSEAIDVWPWQLTPLTSRVLGAFTAQVAVGALLLSRDRRWSAWALIVQTLFVATALLLIGAIRAWEDFDIGNPMTYLYLGGLVAADGALRFSLAVQPGAPPSLSASSTIRPSGPRT